MPANNGVNLYDLSKSGSIEESKKSIQIYITENNNYGSVNGSFFGNNNGKVIISKEDSQTKKVLSENVKLFLEIIGALIGIISGIFGLIKLFT